VVAGIVLDSKVLQQFGPQVATVHAVLAANDHGDGTRMSHRQLAKAAGIAHITARRAVDRLRKAGLLKCESQFQDSCQGANFYQIPTAATLAHGEQTLAHGEQTPAHGEQPNIPTTTTNTDPSLVLEDKKGVVIPGTAEAGDGLRPSGVASNTQVKTESNPERSQLPPAWTSKGTPMPVSSTPPGHKGLFELCREASWLVMHFEGYVLDQMNQALAVTAKKPRTSVGDDRRMRWRRSAIKLLESRSLLEVRETIDWLFTHCSGYLPFEVINKHTRQPSAQDRKVTSIRIVLEHYDRLMAEMVTPKEIRSLEPAVEAGQPRTDYGEPLTDSRDESKVAALLSLFTDFRRACGEGEIDSRRTWAWAKSCRIMLVRYSYSFDDISRVIMALNECRHLMDVERYRDVYHLHCNGEWNQVLGVLEIQSAARKHGDRVTYQESAASSMTLAPTDDGSLAEAENGDGIRLEAEGTAFGRSSMADNIGERRARYAARAAAQGIGHSDDGVDDRLTRTRRHDQHHCG
jgi:hypothetical protein